SPPSSLSSPSHRLREEGRGEGAPLQVQARSEASSPAPLLTVENLIKEYPRSGMTAALVKLFDREGGDEKLFRAVGGISFTITRGESVGLVGESGCGKSTTSMMVMRLIDKTSGKIEFAGEDIGAIPAKEFATQAARKRIQMVF